MNIATISIGFNICKSVMNALNSVESDDQKYDFKKNCPDYNQDDYANLSGLAYSLPGIIFLFFSGFISDNFNRKNVFIFFCLVTGISTFCISLVKEVIYMYPIRILQGISSSFNLLFAFSIVKDTFEEPDL